MSTLTITPEISRKKLSEKQPMSYSILDGIGIACGIGFMYLFSYASGLSVGPPTESNQLMAEFYVANKEIILKVVYLRSLAMALFLVFSCTLADLVRRSNNKQSGILAGILLAAGSLATIMMILGQGAAGVGARITDTPGINPDLIRAMDETSHIVVHLFAVPLAVFLLSATMAIILCRIVPWPFAILSGLSGITLLVTGGTFNSEDTLHSVGVMALIGFLLWLLTISIVLLWKIARSIIAR
jgi:hypothetical protein